jgi:hypothetical protein
MSCVSEGISNGLYRDHRRTWAARLGYTNEYHVSAKHDGKYNLSPPLFASVPTMPFPHHFLTDIQHAWWGMHLYVVSLGFTKTAILCLYPCISPTRIFRICVWVLVGIVACWTLTTLVWSIVYCIPVSDFWDLKAALAGKCPVKMSFIAFTGTSNVITDLAILILPILMLWHVTLPAKTKIGVAIVLATGSL